MKLSNNRFIEIKIIVVIFSLIVIFIVGTILDRLLVHSNIPLIETIYQNLVECILFIIGVLMGFKLRDDEYEKYIGDEK